jgi:hypothetical protein
MRNASPVRDQQLEGVQQSMQTTVLPVGSLVDVTCYCPFRGLKGTIQIVSSIVDGAEEPFCFYLVDLEGTHIPEPIWFAHHEVEAVEVTASPQV